MYPVAITGNWVILRELTGSDAAGLHKIYSSDEATRHFSFEPRTMEQAAAIISAAARSATVGPRTEYMLAVADKDEELIGAAMLPRTGHFPWGDDPASFAAMAEGLRRRYVSRRQRCLAR